MPQNLGLPRQKSPAYVGLEFPFPMETEINCACFQAELVCAHADPAPAPSRHTLCSKSRDKYLRRQVQRSLEMIRHQFKGTGERHALETRSDVLSLAADGDAGAPRASGIRGGLQPRTCQWEARRPEIGRASCR